MKQDDINNPHDAFCKKALSNPETARSLLEEYVPEDIHSGLALDTLIVCKDSLTLGKPQNISDSPCRFAV